MIEKEIKEKRRNKTSYVKGSDQLKPCTICLEHKTLEKYFWRTYKNGKESPYSACKSCLLKIHQDKRNSPEGKAREQELYKLNMLNPEFREKKRASSREFGRKCRLRRAFRRARERALEKGLQFDIDISDLIIPEKCPILNIPLTPNGQMWNMDNSPSIDRINNNKGYTKDNVMIISNKANLMKNSASIDELETFCTNVLELIVKKRDHYE